MNCFRSNYHSLKYKRLTQIRMQRFENQNLWLKLSSFAIFLFELVDFHSSSVQANFSFFFVHIHLQSQSQNKGLIGLVFLTFIGYNHTNRERQVKFHKLMQKFTLT